MDMGINKRVKILFSLRDDFGNYYEFKSDEKLNAEYESLDVFYLIKMFKKFLINAGYTLGVVENITYKGISERDEEDIELWEK